MKKYRITRIVSVAVAVAMVLSFGLMNVQTVYAGWVFFSISATNDCDEKAPDLVDFLQYFDIDELRRIIGTNFEVGNEEFSLPGVRIRVLQIPNREEVNTINFTTYNDGLTWFPTKPSDIILALWGEAPQTWLSKNVTEVGESTLFHCKPLVKESIYYKNLQNPK